VNLRVIVILAVAGEAAEVHLLVILIHLLMGSIRKR
jgi:hypothetical protein